MYKGLKAKPKEKRAQKEASEPNHIRCQGSRAQGKKVAGAKGPSNKDRTNIFRVCMLSKTKNKQRNKKDGSRNRSDPKKREQRAI
jgi:hypothetical protein